MTTTITTPTDTYTATILDGYKVTRLVRTVATPILGSNDLAVSYRPAELRRGTFRLLFEEYTVAAALHDDLATLAAPAQLADTDRPALAMSFTLTGELGFELDDETRDLWWVEIEFLEVTP